MIGVQRAAREQEPVELFDADLAQRFVDGERLALVVMMGVWIPEWVSDLLHAAARLLGGA